MHTVYTEGEVAFQKGLPWGWDRRSYIAGLQCTSKDFGMVSSFSKLGFRSPTLSLSFSLSHFPLSLSLSFLSLSISLYLSLSISLTFVLSSLYVSLYTGGLLFWAGELMTSLPLHTSNLPSSRV